MAHEKKQVDVTTWALPEGAIARLGQGRISGLTFSMDESTLVIWSSLGVWLYDVSTLTPFDLLVFFCSHLQGSFKVIHLMIMTCGLCRHGHASLYRLRHQTMNPTSYIMMPFTTVGTTKQDRAIGKQHLEKSHCISHSRNPSCLCTDLGNNVMSAP